MKPRQFFTPATDPKKRAEQVERLVGEVKQLGQTKNFHEAKDQFMELYWNTAPRWIAYPSKAMTYTLWPVTGANRLKYKDRELYEDLSSGLQCLGLIVLGPIALIDGVAGCVLGFAKDLCKNDRLTYAETCKLDDAFDDVCEQRCKKRYR